MALFMGQLDGPQRVTVASPGDSDPRRKAHVFGDLIFELIRHHSGLVYMLEVSHLA